MRVRVKSTQEEIISNTSVKVTSDTTQEVRAGKSNSVIETNGGRVFVFGNNYYGQLGLGDTTNRAVPTELTAPLGEINATKPLARGNIKKITAGSYSTFVETKDGKLYAFGNNSYGQLGLGIPTDPGHANGRIKTPREITVSGIQGNIKGIFPGAYHTILETKDGKLFVVGNNLYGELGLGNKGSATVKTSFTELTVSAGSTNAIRTLARGNIKRVFAGSYSTFVETKDRKLYAFGKMIKAN